MSAPTNPTLGQMWFDTLNQTLKVWNGTGWRTSLGGVSTGQISAIAPTGPLTGQIWYDTVAGQLKIYNGTSWSTTVPFTSSVSIGKAWAMTAVFGG